MIGQDSTHVRHLAWPASQVGQALETLARQAGLLSEGAAMPPPTEHLDAADEYQFGRWIEWAAGRLGLEAEPVAATYNEVPAMVQQAGPALLRLPGNGAPRFLALLKGTRRHITVISPDFSVHYLLPEVIQRTLTADLEAPLVGPIDQLLHDTGVPEERRPRARQAILAEQLQSARVGGCWLLRLLPGGSFWRQMRQARVPWQLLVMVGGHLMQQLLTVLSGWLILQGILQGRVPSASMWLWGLLLLSVVPCQILVLTAQSRLAVGMGALFKQRLLYGALQLQPDDMRHQGIGQFWGRVMDAEVLETLGLGSGFAELTALVQLITAAVILAVSPDGWLHLCLLGLWLGVMLGLGWGYFRGRQTWIQLYREMTNDLVERLVGHRTRLAQQDYAHWHDEEDQGLAHYLRSSARVDRSQLPFHGFVSQGWILLGFAGMTYTLLVTPASLLAHAILLGGIILAARALQTLSRGVLSGVELWHTWQQCAPLFRAASRPLVHGATFLPVDSAATRAEHPIVLARDVRFRYRATGPAVIHVSSLRIHPGERLLLEGPSGGGKSTLGALLAGLRLPDSGVLLLYGVDHLTLGAEAWRRQVVLAPQFHENYVLPETLAFNLLMGHHWPPRLEDLIEAEQVCRELGLGPLLGRMPAGLFQMVGERGWQLSHGERSRMYIARALLQHAALLILDESFASLDPENLARAVQCVFNRAPTLVVIAHP